MEYNKIFGIGLAKTGTTSLAKALNLLGFSSYHAECDVLTLQDGILDIKEDHSAFLNCQSVVGAPLCPIIDRLNVQYPNSLFILTTRSLERWLISCTGAFGVDSQFDVNHKRMHQLIYGSIYFDKDKFAKGFNKYNKYVLHLFKGNVVHIDIEENSHSQKWNILCKALGVKDFNIDQVFPTENVRASRDAIIRNNQLPNKREGCMEDLRIECLQEVFRFYSHGSISYHDFIVLLTFCKGKEIVVELGTCSGTTTRLISFMAERVYTYDVFEDLYLIDDVEQREIYKKNWIQTKHNFREVISALAHRNNVFVQKSMSHLATKNWEKKTLDVLFIDADHSYNGVKLDYDSWFDKVKIDGLFIFHDVIDTPQLKGVFQFYKKELLKDKRIEELRTETIGTSMKVFRRLN